MKSFRFGKLSLNTDGPLGLEYDETAVKLYIHTDVVVKGR